MRRRQYFVIILLFVVFILLIIVGSYFAVDDRLSNILLTVFSTILGGLIAYYGVVKTIEYGIKERMIAEEKHVAERKDDERKSLIPYLKVTTEGNDCCSAHISVFDEVSYEDLQEGKEQNAFAVAFADFNVKNISSAVIVLIGIDIGHKFYKFDEEHVLGKGDICRISNNGDKHVGFLRLPDTITLKVRDAIGNDYCLECKVNKELATSVPQGYGNGRVHFSYHLYNYKVVELSLPKLFEK